MPSAVKNTFWRITLIYISTLTMIGLLLPYTEERLGGSGARASPFVLVFANAGVSGIDSLVNSASRECELADIAVTICISVLSIGLSCVFAGSRTMTALAEVGALARKSAPSDPTRLRAEDLHLRRQERSPALLRTRPARLWRCRLRQRLVERWRGLRLASRAVGSVDAGHLVRCRATGTG